MREPGTASVRMPPPGADSGENFAPSCFEEDLRVTAASASRIHAGIFPIAPTPFTDAGDLDPTGARRVLDCMIDQGVDGICVLANYSEQFLLTDDEPEFKPLDAQRVDVPVVHPPAARPGLRSGRTPRD